MVKRFAFLLVFLTALATARPASAQDFSRLDIGFGISNYGVQDASEGFISIEEKRANGFVMHTDLNLVRWFTFENVRSAYAMNNDITLLTNTFGVKLIARDMAGGRVSPYVAAGFGFGYYRSNQTGGSQSNSAARLGGGIDLNMSDGIALRFDVSKMALSSSLANRDWHSDTNIAAAVVFSLGN